MSNKKFVVDTNRAPRAIGPYSQAVGYEGLLFISGQTAVDARTGQMSSAGVEQQTRVVMDHVQSILMAAGLDTSHVLRVTVYLRNMNDYDIVNDIYALYFDHSPPARTVIEVSRLPKDGLVAVDVVAAAPADYTTGREDASYDASESESSVADTQVDLEALSDQDVLGGEEQDSDETSREDSEESDVAADGSTEDESTEDESTEDESTEGESTEDESTEDESTEDESMEKEAAENEESTTSEEIEVQKSAKKTLPFGTIPAPARSSSHEEE